MLTNYFTLAATDDGGVGVCMSSYYLPPRVLQSLNHCFRTLLTEPLTVEELLSSTSIETVLEHLTTSTRVLVKRAIDVAAVGALSVKCLKEVDGECFELHHDLPIDVLEGCTTALVVGFGGYMHGFANDPRLNRVYVVDLTYHVRKAEMDSFALRMRQRFPHKEIFVSDGSDTAKLLRAVDIVSITGSALGNGTMEDLLLHSRNCKRVIVQGCSAAIHPKALFDRGVSLVSTRIDMPLEFIELARRDVTGNLLRPLFEHGLREVNLLPHSNNALRGDDVTKGRRAVHS